MKNKYSIFLKIDYERSMPSSIFYIYKYYLVIKSIIIKHLKKYYENGKIYLSFILLIQ